jgi:hypothetical protein
MSGLFQGLFEGARRRGRRIASPAGLPTAFLLSSLLAALAACQAPAPRAVAPFAAPAKAHEPEDASYDWHVLLAAPMGSVLKEVPLTLHEVLLFRDEEHAGAAADDAAAGAPECYAADSAAPRFVGRTPDEYLLCFRQDRLSRIQASVRLPAAQASDIFAEACALWLKNAAATETQGASATTGAACEGRDGATRFSAHLAEESGVAGAPAPTDADAPSPDMILSLTLDGAPGP